jgi:hypothetical protein
MKSDVLDLGVPAIVWKLDLLAVEYERVDDLAAVS